MSKRKKRKIGLSPGSVVYTGTLEPNGSKLSKYSYSIDDLQFSFDTSVNDNFLKLQANYTHWIDLQGLQDVQSVEKLAKHWNLHPIAIENIVDVEQRPKVEELPEGIFIIFDTLIYTPESGVTILQNAHFFNKNVLLSFEEGREDHYTSVKKRIENAFGRIRQKGPDYLSYALIDSQVDGYYLALDMIEERMENLERGINSLSHNFIRDQIMTLKRELLIIKRSAHPLKEAIGKLARLDSDFIENTTQVYFRDLYDHLVQIMDNIEIQRDIINGIYELYSTQINLRMNNIMKALTIISAIFIPLSFIASVYGMNFENMPELKTQNGYYFVLGGMFLLLLGMIGLFKKRGWFD